MAEYWVREYHVDGFRLDESKSINNWDFAPGFRERARQAHQTLFFARPFLVVAEDSNQPDPVGSVIVVYLTGVGPLDHPVEDGQPAGGPPLSRATSSYSAVIRGKNT